MKPDRTNYNIWLIDLHDGNLSDDQIRLVMEFLDENPDLKEEFEDLSSFRVNPEQYSFPDRNRLKKSYSELTPDQFELLCIAAIEGDLPESEKPDLDKFLSENPVRKKDYELLESVKLKAPVVTYHKKASLKKLTALQKTVRYSLIGLSAAASVLILIAIFIYPFGKKKISELLIASNQFTDTIQIVKADPVIYKKIYTDISSFRNHKQEIILQDKEVRPADFLKEVVFTSPVVDSAAFKKDMLIAGIDKVDYIGAINLSVNFSTDSLISLNIREVPDSDPFYHPGINDFITKLFREKILKSKTPETGSLKIYEVADAGINGINRLLGWQMSLKQTRDRKGELKSLYFSSKIIKFNAPVKKAQVTL